MLLNKTDESIEYTDNYGRTRYYMASLIAIAKGGGGTPPYLKVEGKFCAIDPLFDILQSHWVPILYPNQAWLPLSAEKNRFVSITYTILKHFIPIFSVDLFFILFLDLFDSSVF